MKRLILFLFLVGLGYLLFTLILGISPYGVARNFVLRERLRSEIILARALWNNNNISSYSITVGIGDRIGDLMQGHGIYQGSCILVLETLMVQDNEVIKSEVYPLESCIEVYNQLTVEKMFDYISRSIEHTPITVSIEAEFDPVFGYATHFRLERPSSFFSAFSYHPEDFSYSNLVIH